MAGGRVWVLTASTAIRETVAIILGETHDVVDVDPEDVAAVDPQATVVIASGDALPAHRTAALAGHRPVVWIEYGPHPRPATAADWRALPYPFSPGALRDAVGEASAGGRPVSPSPSLGFLLGRPFLSERAQLRCDRAVRSEIPALLCGERGSGKARLARAICAFSHNPHLVEIDAESFDLDVVRERLSGDNGPASLLVREVEAASPRRQAELLRLIDDGGVVTASGHRRARVLATSLGPPAALEASLEPQLFYRLSVLAIDLPPLRDRGEDLAAIVDRLLVEAAHSLGSIAPEVTPEAIERLRRYVWSGNLGELTSVLTRSLAHLRGSVLDRNDLVFVDSAAPSPRPEPDEVARESKAGDEATDQTVDMVIHELAHEFKNPMVTIKTVAQQLGRVLNDKSDRRKVAQLTGDAVDRMDRALENLLQFTRFRAPQPTRIGANDLLDGALSQGGAATGFKVRRKAPPRTAWFNVDVEQMTYALENLLRVIEREISPGEDLVVGAPEEHAGLQLEYPTEAQQPGSRLAEMLDDTHNGEVTALPLGFVLAKALVERNGGRMETTVGDGIVRISICLPGGKGIVAGDGKAANSGGG